MSKTFLKMKICSLAAEARIIRREERKWPGESHNRFWLRQHRVMDVRGEARAACLAYGYLRGRRYRQLEKKAHTKPRWSRVNDLVKKYGGKTNRDIGQDLKDWYSEVA